MRCRKGYPTVVVLYSRKKGSEHRGLVYVVRDNDGGTHLGKVAGATSFNLQRLERINRASPKQAANLLGLMQRSTPNPQC